VTLAEPVISRITGKPTTILARKLTNANGVFLGIMLRRIDAIQFEKFLDTLALGNNATVSIASNGGELLARFPRSEGVIGNVRRGAIF
jgi:hypothetical protein